jgi:hypothetical protein
MALNKQKIQPIYRLILRLIMIPIAHTARLILVTAIFIGWGKHAASSLWNNTK